MKRRLVVPFTKMHGAGNDFIVIDNRFFHFSPDELSRLAATYCRRRYGVGADGLLALDDPQDEAHHYRMRYYNADGSMARMCGNGARCLARFAREAGIEGSPLVFESEAGLYRAEVHDAEGAPVRLYVPPPERFTGPMMLDGSAEPVWYVWTGTDHAVLFVHHVQSVDVEARGRSLRHDPAFAPAGANVDFVELVRNATDMEVARVRLRTYERGVEAETLACGTGALAAAVVPRLLGHVNGEEVEVEVPGGLLRVGFRAEGDALRDVYLQGPAETVFTGTLEIDP
jgi:diaminopimelate epimerase